MRDLEDSLALGPPVIQGQYAHDLKRFGESYACGDSQAREQMKDILITLQLALLSNLQGVLMDNETLEFSTLQTASDDSRVNAVVCLGQLSQRISAAATATAMLPQQKITYSIGSGSAALSPSLMYSSSRSTRSSGSGSQPMTPDPTINHLAQMTYGQYGHKPTYAERTPSSFSNHSDPRGIYPRRSNDPRTEVGILPPPLRVPRKSNGSMEGMRRPSSQALSPDDTFLLVPGPGPYNQSTQPATRLGSDVGEDPDRAYISAHSSRNGEQFPEISRASSDGQSFTSRDRDRFGPNDYDDFNYTRGGLDDPNLDYGAIYGNRSVGSSIGTRSVASLHQNTESTNYSTLEHIVYLQSNARPPNIDNYNHTQQVQSPHQLGPGDSNLPSNRYRPMPYRVHNGTQSQLRERTHSLVSSQVSSENSQSLYSPTAEPKLTGLAAADAADSRAYKKDLSKPLYQQVRPQRDGRSSSSASNPGNSRKSSSTGTTNASQPAPSFLRSAASTFHLTSYAATQPLSLPLNLPSESALHGFCKGAIKLQSGSLKDNKKAFTVANRPSGFTGTIPFWQCTKCSFDGPVVISVITVPGKKAGKAEKCFDTRVRESDGGIRYRWTFLAKCHVMGKSLPEGPTARDGSFGAFACLFCCAEGHARGWRMATENGAPIFGNVASFMEHLQMHREVEGRPGVEMQTRAKCVVGRVAEMTEDFDINLPPL